MAGAVDLQRELERAGVAEQVQVSVDVEVLLRAAVGRRGVDHGRLEADRAALEHVVSIDCWMLSLSSSPSACAPPAPAITFSELESAVSDSFEAAGSSANSNIADHEETVICRLCPAIAAAPRLPVLTVSVAESGPSLYVPA